MRPDMLFKRIGATLLAFLVGLCCMATAAYADESIDTAKKASLTVYFGQGGKGFSEVEFAVYKVADVSASGEYALAGDFQNYPVEWKGLDSSGWRALAQTLDAYVARDELPAWTRARTGQDGTFCITECAVGLYLVTGEPYVSGDTVYTPEPMLVALPGLAQGVWNYDVEVSCKFDQEPQKDETVSRKVQKVWKDDDNSANKRPVQISVQLLKDGVVVDTVVLNQANNWEHTWSDLDSSAKWQVTEARVPDGYTVAVSRQGDVFIVTNTCQGNKPPKLPQTGMLWWPVPLLACGGLLLVGAGLMVRYKQEDQNGK